MYQRNENIFILYFQNMLKNPNIMQWMIFYTNHQLNLHHNYIILAYIISTWRGESLWGGGGGLRVTPKT